MSGMTRSIPNISSSGSIRPQSITTISSRYSKTYMFLPISPTPPSGMIRSGWSLVGGILFLGIGLEERQLWHGIIRRAGGGWRRLADRLGERLTDRRPEARRLAGPDGPRGVASRSSLVAPSSRVDEGRGNRGHVGVAFAFDGRR